MRVLTKLFTVAVGITILNTFIAQKAFSAPIEFKADEANKVIGVRVSDFQRYAETEIPRLKDLVSMMKNQTGLFFKNQVLELHGVFFRELPEINGDTVTLHLDAMIAHNEYFKSRESLGWPGNIALTEL